MDTFNPQLFIGTLAIVGVVIFVSALLSGLTERSGFPQVAVFLAIGAAIGPAGLGLLDITLNSAALRIVATLSLALVLFIDAVNLDMNEVRRHGLLALRLLGPGTLVSAGIISLAAWWLLRLPPAAAVILGAALASTDPVLLRGFLRRRDVPTGAQQALRLESGLNDAVLLPAVLIAMAVLGQGAAEGTENSWGQLLLNQFLLGPGAGIAVGLLAVATLDLVRRRFGVRRDYEALYALGIAFCAFAAAEAVHGSGFLAAFAAGLTIAALDVELCDCFVEYGETTSEMALLLTFALLGGSLIWSGLGLLSLATLAFVIIALLVRLPIYFLALFGAEVDRHSRRLIAWFGPRGLSSLLLVLLPVFAGIPGSETLFALCSLVVIFSILVHGGSMMILFRANGTGQGRLPPAPGARRTVTAPDGSMPRPAEPAPPVAEAEAPAAWRAEGPDDIRLSIDELQHLWEAGVPVTLLDVRSDRGYRGSDEQAQGAVRLLPDYAVERAQELDLPKDHPLVAYCA